MPAIARIGDAGSHGGVIITGASRTLCEGAQIARQGDLYGCPIHGANPIVSWSGKLRVEGAAAARFGDLTACGAIITSGASRTLDE